MAWASLHAQLLAMLLFCLSGANHLLSSDHGRCTMFCWGLVDAMDLTIETEWNVGGHIPSLQNKEMLWQQMSCFLYGSMCKFFFRITYNPYNNSEHFYFGFDPRRTTKNTRACWRVGISHESCRNFTGISSISLKKHENRKLFPRTKNTCGQKNTWAQNLDGREREKKIAQD